MLCWSDLFDLTCYILRIPPLSMMPIKQCLNCGFVDFEDESQYRYTEVVKSNDVSLDDYGVTTRFFHKSDRPSDREHPFWSELSARESRLAQLVSYCKDDTLFLGMNVRAVVNELLYQSLHDNGILLCLYQSQRLKAVQNELLFPASPDGVPDCFLHAQKLAKDLDLSFQTSL